MNITVVVFGSLFIGGIGATLHLIASLLNITKSNVALDKLQYHVLWNVAISNLIQPFCSSLNIALSSFQPSGIGIGARCNLDAEVTYLMDMSTMYLIVTLCLHRTIFKGAEVKATTRTGLILVCWCFGAFWSLPPLFGVAPFIPKGGNAFCCLNWQSEKIVEKMFLYGLVLIGFSLPIILQVLTYLHQTFFGDLETNTSESYIPIGSLARTAFLRIALGQVHSGLAIIQVFRIGVGMDFVTKENEFIGVALALMSYIVTPYFLSVEVNKIIQNDTKKQ